MYMYKFGGVYADLDFRALKPMDSLLRGGGHRAVVGRLSDEHEWDENIPNAWMASSPGHPFWMFCLMEIAKGSVLMNCEGDDCTRDYIIERTTGPWMLWRSVRYFQNYGDPKKDGTLTILEPKIVYPINWNAPYPVSCKDDGTWNETACYQQFPDSFAITYWSHGWGES